MSELPILFNAAMVNAVLSGAKTQTRRPVKFPSWFDADSYSFRGDGFSDTRPTEAGDILNHCTNPFGDIGDVLYVRETWGRSQDEFGRPVIVYRADETARYEGAEEIHGPVTFKFALPMKFHPSLHMKHWMSRIKLQVTNIRVQRLQDITPEDAIAEGCCPSVGSGFDDPVVLRRAAKLVGGPYPRGIFAQLWESIYGDESWEKNGWAWVADFDLVKGA